MLQHKDLTLLYPDKTQAEITTLSPLVERISLRWQGESVSPGSLELRWTVPLIDTQFEWHPSCGFDRSLRVDWQAPVSFKISSSAPVFCFYNAAGRSRFTMALSDVKTLLHCSLGVHEEDGTLLCRVEVPLKAGEGEQAYELLLYRSFEDLSFAEALRRVTAWWEKDCGLAPSPVPTAAKEPFYSCWYSFHQETIAQEIEEESRRAAALGMKTLIVDDGWQTADSHRGYAYCGDWQPAKEKIPDMAAHVRKVHENGVKYMLWYSVPFVGYRSRHFVEFRDKLLTMNDAAQAAVLDPRYPEVRAYLIGVYEKALLDWDLDGFKLDFIDSFTPERGKPLPPRTPGMDFDLVEDAVDCLMTEVLGRLRSIKPDILIEFRQSYIGPCMRGYGNLFRVSDCPNDAISNRVGIVDLRMTSGNTAVHSDMLMWHRDDTPQAVALQLQGVVFGVPQVSVRLDKLSEEQARTLRFWLTFMQEEKELLLETPLEVESPQELYPLVSARRDGRALLAVYAGGHAAPIEQGDREVLVLNASLADALVLISKTPRRFRAELLDHKGDRVETRELLVDGAYLLPAPPCGLARLTALD